MAVPGKGPGPQTNGEVCVTAELTVRSAEVGGLWFAYDERVLQPRAWTAAQAEWARVLLGELPAGPVLELCSGAGHIGLLALLDNTRSLVMVDADEAACEMAARNASALAMDQRVEVRQGRFESALRDDEVFPFVIADPPWVPTNEVASYPEDPVTAIDGGPDGLGPTRACLEVVDGHLLPAGSCVLQVGNEQHVEGIRADLTEHPDLRLEVAEVRTHDRGVLVLLRRPVAGGTC